MHFISLLCLLWKTIVIFCGTLVLPADILFLFITLTLRREDWNVVTLHEQDSIVTVLLGLSGHDASLLFRCDSLMLQKRALGLFFAHQMRKLGYLSLTSMSVVRLLDIYIQICSIYLEYIT